MKIMNLRDEINKLSKPEKILLVEEIWDGISADREDDLSEEQKNELDRRLQLDSEGKMNYYSMDEVKERIKALRNNVHGYHI